ncbi:hypothetical protein OUZ56_012339 [Daphnia magna]|uniref:Uncharacterized protein n=1 Tax=Daphnia magna TaxID=35525 RepID=A0ABQ9Z2W6_9CRUS|nr:hypothetical protein OUZ56_012339 [Daphnia magna]
MFTKALPRNAFERLQKLLARDASSSDSTALRERYEPKFEDSSFQGDGSSKWEQQAFSNCKVERSDREVANQNSAKDNGWRAPSSSFEERAGASGRQLLPKTGGKHSPPPGKQRLLRGHEETQA